MLSMGREIWDDLNRRIHRSQRAQEMNRVLTGSRGLSLQEGGVHTNAHGFPWSIRFFTAGAWASDELGPV
jgi:hypothetical protein